MPSRVLQESPIITIPLDIPPLKLILFLSLLINEVLLTHLPLNISLALNFMY